MSVVKHHKFEDVEYFGFTYSPVSFFPKHPVYIYLLDDILIDTAQSNMRRQFTELVNKRNIDRAIITHYHEDHSGNIPVLKDKNIPVFAHPLGVELLQNPETISTVENWVWGKAESVDVIPLTETITTKNFVLEIIHTPGHSPDHICLLERNNGWLFCGDLYVHSSINFFISNECMMKQINSLRNVLQYDFDVVFCGHNPQLLNARAKIASKLRFFEDFYGKVSDYYYQGYNKSAIMRILNIREHRLLKYLSGGRLSARNMINSIVRTEQEKLFSSIITENLVE